MKYLDLKGVPDFESFEISDKSSDYCVLIPIINEGSRILSELQRAKDAGVDKIADIIICDGGSTDGATELEKLKGLSVNTLLVKTGVGKQGAQLRMGLYYALKRGYTGFVTIDGNNKDSIEDVYKFIDKLKDGYDLIQGSRFIRGGVAENTPISRYLAVRLIHAPVISLTAGKWYTDTTNAYRGYSKRYITDKRLNPFRDIFSGYELLAYLSTAANKLNLRSCEVAVSRVYPKGEEVPTKIKGFHGNSNLLKILFKNALGHYNYKL